MMDDPNQAIASLLAQIDRLADETGDPRLVRASRATRQLSPGRPSIDDRAAIAEAERLLATGKVRSKRAALLKVSRTIAVHGNVRSVYERLRLKMKKGAKE